jgi:hypothetical protein
MTRISQHSFPALQQHGLIEGGIGGESCFYRQGPNRCSGVVESRALDESKAWVSGRQSTEQGNKAGPEKCDAHRRPFRKGPAANDVAPQKRQNEEIAPNHQFEIVPIPRRGFNEIANAEDHNGG